MRVVAIGGGHGLSRALALARDRDFAELFGHRFSRGELTDHAVGNLVLGRAPDGSVTWAHDPARLAAVLRDLMP